MQSPELNLLVEGAQVPPTKKCLAKRCLICADKSDGNHFGIDSCRACAAFFRRSVTGAKKYHCRQGKNSCEVSKSVKSMCRQCRLTKCLTSGMKPESVRDPIVPRTDPSLPCTSEIQSAFRKVNPLRTLPDEIDANLFSRILKDQLCSVRRATELAMSDQSIRGFFNNENTLKGYSCGTFSKISKFYRAHTPATVDFITACFPEFNDFNPQQKWMIFRSFMIHFWGLDNNYRTYKAVPMELQEQYTLLTETTYCDLLRLDEFFDNMLKESNKQEMKKLLPKVLAPAKTIICKPMFDMKLEEEEFAFLIALVLWGIDVEKSSPEIDEYSRKMRDRLYTALENHYCVKYRYASRIGELHTIHCGIIQFAAMLREYTELFNLLDVYESDSFIHDFIKS